MFPTEEKTPALIDSRVTLDDFIKNMSIDKDETGFNTNLEIRSPVPMPGRERILTPEEQAKLSEDTAAAAGDQLAGLVDNGTRALCGIIGSEKDDKYRISAGQRRDLADSYGRIAKHYGFSGANPLIEGILLTFIILAPKFKEAFSDRKMKKIEEEQQRQADEQRKMAAEIASLKAKAEIQKMNSDGAETTDQGK